MAHVRGTLAGPFPSVDPHTHTHTSHSSKAAPTVLSVYIPEPGSWQYQPLLPVSTLPNSGSLAAASLILSLPPLKWNSVGIPLSRELSSAA